ncbi:MAG: sensory rhodopsin transducer [Verrucomicrobia bacterium]|nr:sensory rhodopsin transducer [Verrucomicrobiota bacterium]
MENAIGTTRWVIPEGYIPRESHGPAPELTSHEAFCVINAGERAAHLRVTVFYTDREPGGPYLLEVPARRTRHFRFNDLEAPEPIPVGTPYSSLIESDLPVVVQHTRLDSRQSENALMTTIAYPCERAASD